ncbi:MAG TPA: Holliday junction branch migration protein RuvA [Candidatus Paceibacterota bacterium]|nr:Holliday junction branch migration protein RuvA [Candidatus Paceibacterota bacterium]
MIGKLTGKFGGTSQDGTALIEVAGVGYAVRLPAGVLAAIRAASGDISLYIHTAVREDAIDLYGFAEARDLEFFRLLVGVSGIGPKSALGILNLADVPTLKRGVARGDSSMLTKVFGIGKKSAERIVVELRDKLADEPAAPGENAGTEGEVIEALMALGYSAGESRKAVKEIMKESGDAGVRERLALALKYLGSNG